MTQLDYQIDQGLPHFEDLLVVQDLKMHFP